MVAAGELSNTTIDHLLQHVPGYGGCGDKTQILRRLHGSASQGAGQFFIINLETGPPGTHWTFYDARQPSHRQYFDSFGYPPPVGYSITEYNTHDCQPLSSSYCGWYCIFVASQLSPSQSINSFVRQHFSSSPQANDRIIQRFRQSYSATSRKASSQRTTGTGLVQRAKGSTSMDGGGKKATRPVPKRHHVSAKELVARLHSRSHREKRAGRSVAHPGFAHVASTIAHHINPHTGKPYGLAHARAILASRTRHASSSAKRANPKLNRVPV